MYSEDPNLKAEISGLKTKMLEFELRLARRWVVAIYLAFLALSVAFLGAFLTKS